MTQLQKAVTVCIPCRACGRYQKKGEFKILPNLVTDSHNLIQVYGLAKANALGLAD